MTLGLSKEDAEALRGDGEEGKNRLGVLVVRRGVGPAASVPEPQGPLAVQDAVGWGGGCEGSSSGCMTHWSWTCVGSLVCGELGAGGDPAMSNRGWQGGPSGSC